MISKRYLFSAALLLAAFVTTATHAMTIETRGNTVYATGELGDDYVKFKEAFAQPGIKRVVFVNSPGGDLWNNMHIGHLIRERGLDTYADPALETRSSGQKILMRMGKANAERVKAKLREIRALVASLPAKAAE